MNGLEVQHSRSGSARGRRALDSVFEHALISKTFPYAYYHVPKCACTTLKNMLWRVEAAHGANVRRDVEPSMVHLMQGDPRSPWLAKPSSIAGELARPQQGRFWFIVVRNPYARVFSAYQWLFVDGNEEMRSQYAAKLGWTGHDLPSFSTFVELVAEQQELEMDHHWAPISSFVPLDDIEFDAVAHVEDFGSDMSRIMGEVFGQAETFDASLRMFKSSSPGWARSAESVPDRTIDLIQRVYAHDFAKFGYSTDPHSTMPLNANEQRERAPSKISEELRFQSSVWASRTVSGPDSATVADVAKRFPDTDAGPLAGLVLRNSDLPSQWNENGCQLWAAPSVPLPSIIPHPGIPFPTEALIILAGDRNPTQIVLWGDGCTIVVCSGVQLPDAIITCGEGGSVFIGPRVVSSGAARIDIRNGGSITVEGDGLWFQNVRLLNDGLHAIRDRTTGARVNAHGAELKIGPHVWLGDGVIVEPGGRIGAGSAIENRSRVTTRLPENCLCGGNPAVVKRENISWGYENNP